MRYFLAVFSGFILGFAVRGLVEYYVVVKTPEPVIESISEIEYPDLPEGAINDLRRK